VLVAVRDNAARAFPDRTTALPGAGGVPLEVLVGCRFQLAVSGQAPASSPHRPRIERVPQPVADDVGHEDRGQDRPTREHPEAPRRSAPRRVRRLDSGPEDAQRRLRPGWCWRARSTRAPPGLDAAVRAPSPRGSRPGRAVPGARCEPSGGHLYLWLQVEVQRADVGGGRPGGAPGDGRSDVPEAAGRALQLATELRRRDGDESLGPLADAASAQLGHAVLRHDLVHEVLVGGDDGPRGRAWAGCARWCHSPPSSA
jgi:hypothetical protein